MTSNIEKKCEAEKRKKMNNYSRATLLFIVFVSLLAGCGLTEEEDKYPKSLGGEMRKTLSPGYFYGKTGKAYQSAKEIPQILDGIYCYCHCQKHSGHKSLLSCFVDKHGSQCGACINQAIMAHELHKQGLKKKEIVKQVNAIFYKKDVKNKK